MSLYNYKTIPTEDVTEGMVLSGTDTLFMQQSRVKGLPALSDETLRSRITAEEADSVKRWGKSKYGKSEISIVRKIPFAAFLSIGKDINWKEASRIINRMENAHIIYLKASRTKFEKLRQLVENVYTNDYLNGICVNWNRELKAADGVTNLPKQIHFYDNYIRSAKERTVVIISDALRYEVGYSLFRKLQADEKCKVKIEPMQSVVPSYTRLGMAALLPHRKLEMTDDFEVLVDGKGCNDTAHREPILQSYKPNSRAVQYDDLKNMSVAQLREVFTNQEVVYVYHNQVDARGDKPNTENEVFTACEEAIEEIAALIRRLTVSANTVHFIVTADHGFIYKRDKLTESDKILCGSKSL